MGLPNNGGENAPTKHLMPPNKTLVLGMGCIFLSCWPKSHGDPLACASKVLELKIYTTIPDLRIYILED